jgi:hypothetical protein
LQGFGVPAESYGFANKRLASETIAPLLDRASPLLTARLRDPVGPQIQFASESFIDEIAAAIVRSLTAHPALHGSVRYPVRVGWLIEFAPDSPLDGTGFEAWSPRDGWSPRTRAAHEKC